jgi:FdhE protein
LSNARQLPAAIDFLPFADHFQHFLGSGRGFRQSRLAQGASELRNKGEQYCLELLTKTWTAERNDEVSDEHFFAAGFLQPIAEYFAQNAALLSSSQGLPTCPYCGRHPVCGVLRPESDGAKRSLICSFCSTEWPYRRLICPSCEQEDVERLPIYSAEGFGYIRIEACDVCKTFVKTIDLSKDGRAIPVVDELASLPLTLWAQEKGYNKLQQNLVLM